MVSAAKPREHLSLTLRENGCRDPMILAPLLAVCDDLRLDMSSNPIEPRVWARFAAFVAFVADHRLPTMRVWLQAGHVEL